MKKLFSVILASACACVLFTGCGKETASDNNADATNSVATDNSGSEAATADENLSALTIDFDNLETISLQDITAADYVTLGEYTGIPVEAVLSEVTDEDVTAYVNDLFAGNPPVVEVTDRAVQEGDTVNIDYVGKYADTKEAFDGGTAEGASLTIGSNTYIEGFESGLVGVNIGETVDLDLTFPENYGATDLAGKAVVFTVTVNGITVPSDEMTDEWAAGLGYEGVTDLATLNDYAKKVLEESAQSDYEATIENGVYETIFSTSSFGEVPEKLVNRYLGQQKQMLDYRATMYTYMYGQTITTDDVINIYMQNEGYVGTADEYLTSVAKDMANQYVMFQAIADKEGIEVSDIEIDEYLQEAYNSASSTAFSSFDDYKASLDLEVYREGLMAEKVMDFMIEKANVIAQSAE